MCAGGEAFFVLSSVEHCRLETLRTVHCPISATFPSLFALAGCRKVAGFFVYNRDLMFGIVDGQPRVAAAGLASRIGIRRGEITKAGMARLNSGFVC